MALLSWAMFHPPGSRQSDNTRRFASLRVRLCDLTSSLLPSSALWFLRDMVHRQRRLDEEERAMK